jgi:hypothetical protein
MKKPTLSTQILIGLGLGMACGLFFGEYCAPLGIAGDAFIGLLQMTVLPYIVLSLLVNLGRLSLDRGRRLAAAGLAVLGIFTTLGIVAVLTTPLTLPEWAPRLTGYLSDAGVGVVPSPRAFTQGEVELDVVLFTAEAGSAWTLLYPSYTVAIPQPDVVRVPMAYAMTKGDEEFAVFVDAWVEMVTRDGTVDRLYDHWILGEGAAETSPRWSVIRDILQWVD